MLREVFGRALADQRRALVGWSIGVAAYTAMVLSIFPSIHTKAEDFNKLIEHYPSALKAFFGVTDIGSPAGYLTAELLLFMAPMLLVLYAVSHASGATATEEERGTIDLLLATPVTRSQIVVAKAAAITVAVIALGAVLFITIVGFGPVVGLHVGVGNVAASVGGIVLFALLAEALALAFGAATGRRALARGLAAITVLAAYLVSSLAPLASWLEPWRPLSPFYHAIGRDPLRHGLAFASTGAIAVSVIAIVALAAWAFDRRDLSV